MINLEYSTKQMISYFIIVNRNFTLYKDKRSEERRVGKEC